jgi:hypothetical protein
MTGTPFQLLTIGQPLRNIQAECSARLQDLAKKTMVKMKIDENDSEFSASLVHETWRPWRNI